MTAVIPSTGANGKIPAPWWGVYKALGQNMAAINGIQTNITRIVGIDQYQNVTAIEGQLAASVTQGGGFTSGVATPANKAVPGTQSSTGLTGFGRAKCVYFPATTSAGNNNSGGTNTTMTVTNLSTTVTIASGTNTVNGMGIAGYGIPAGTTIVSGGGTTTLVISNASTATGSGLPCSIFQWQQQ